MCVEVIVCYISVVFFRQSVYGLVGKFAELAKLAQPEYIAKFANKVSYHISVCN